MVIVVAEVETEAPLQFVAVRVKGTTVATATTGAV